MRFVLNIIWLLLSGLWLAIGYGLIGVLLCCTIVLAPFGLQLFKIAGYALWPFGRSLVKTTEIPGASTVGNLLWLPAGLFLAVTHLLAACACAITIIGIPFAIANLKMVAVALTPFGRTVVSDGTIAAALRTQRAAA